MRLTKDEIEAVKARADAATVGPWRACESDVGVPCTCGYVYAGPGFLCRMTTPEEADPAPDLEHRQLNARFIAHARTDVPALCDHALQREQDVVDLVTLVQQVKPRYFQSDDGHKTCSSCGATYETHFDGCWNTRAQAVLARIREQEEA